MDSQRIRTVLRGALPLGLGRQWTRRRPPAHDFGFVARASGVHCHGRLADERAEKEARKQKYLNKRLTKLENYDTVVKESEVVQPENELVEGVREAETPLGSLLGEITIS